MENIFLYSIISVLIVSLISFIGIFTLSIKSKSLNKVLIYFVSFSAGALLGDAFIHLIPEIIKKDNFNLNTSIYVLSGIIVFFILEKIVHWRHCHGNLSDKNHIHPFTYMSLVGDGLHNFIDGLIITASYLASIQIGITTTIAIILHEIPQEIGDFGILVHGGFSKGKALLINFLSGLTAIIGAGIAFWLGTFVKNIELFLIPFTAGAFIYIAGVDLIPELHKEIKISNSIIQLISLILGIAVMALLLFL